MKKQLFISLSVLALVPGCGFRRTKRVERRPASKHEVITDVNIPVASHNVKDFFDEELDMSLMEQPMAVALEDEGYDWVDQNKNTGFKKIFFDYDSYKIKSSEKVAIDYNIARMKELLDQEEANGKEVQFIINGNSDSIFGPRSDVYNRILSEKRAKELKNYAVAAGIPSHKIKIVGRGADMPEVINGKACVGDIAQQAPNRRDEIQILVA